MKQAAMIAGVAVLLGALTGSADAAGVTSGEAAPEFTLTDTNGKAHSLSAFKGKVVVLEWLNHQCPFVKKHYSGGNMQALQKQYTDKGVVWLSIASTNPNHRDYRDAEALNAQAQDAQAAPTAILRDDDGTVGKQYGARTTPHMYVIDAAGTLAYQGAIDSIRSARPADIEKAENYVSAVVDALLAGDAAPHSATAPYGCGVKY